MREMFNYIDLDTMYKFADKQGILDKLKLIASEEIYNYCKELREDLCGTVLKNVNKNRAITLDEIKVIVGKKEKSIGIRLEKEQSITKDLNIDDRLRTWYVAKDSENRKLILDNNKKILDFINVNDKFELASYTVRSLLDYIDNFERLGQSQSQSQDVISQYIGKALGYADDMLGEINNIPFVNWAKIKYLSIAGEWGKTLRKAALRVPFDQLVAETAKIQKDTDDGVYRDGGAPDTPFRHGEYETLTSNLEFLADWQANANEGAGVNISGYSLGDAVKSSNEWHKKEADSGTGLSYNPINNSDIVWEDSENNGFFILELKDKRDLKVEGAKQSHCVGSYGLKIKNKTSRIFSLRNRSDKDNPILTIETDMSGGVVRQDYGDNNKKLETKYHDMVTEWSSKNKVNFEYLNASDKAIFISKITDATILSEIVAKTDDSRVLGLVVKNKAVDATILLEIVAKTDNSHILEYVAKNKAVDATILLAIATKTNELNILNAVAENPAADAAILSAIVAKTDDPDLLQDVAENPAADATILSEILAKTNDSYVLKNVAENPAADATILSAIRSKLSAIVAKTYDLRMLNAVAKNIAADATILSAIRPKLSEIVAKANNKYELSIAAENIAADATILSAIITKTESLLLNTTNRFNGAVPHILKNVAENPAADATILSAIVAKTDDAGALQSVALNKAADAAILSAIVAKTNDLNTLVRVSGNIAADATILSAIVAKTNDSYVLGAVARNPAANATILSEILAKTNDSYVLKNVAENPAADVTILSKILAKTNNPNVIKNDPYLLKAVAKNPDANATILSEILAKTDNTDVIKLVEDKLDSMASIKSEASVNIKINNIHNKAIKYYLMAKYASY